MTQLANTATIAEILAQIQSLEGINQKSDLASALAAKGYTLTGNETIADLIIILSGPNLINTTTALGATAAEIFTGKEAFINGVKRVGTAPPTPSVLNADFFTGLTLYPIDAHAQTELNGANSVQSAFKSMRSRKKVVLCSIGYSTTQDNIYITATDAKSGLGNALQIAVNINVQFHAEVIGGILHVWYSDLGNVNRVNRYSLSPVALLSSGVSDQNSFFALSNNATATFDGVTYGFVSSVFQLKSLTPSANTVTSSVVLDLSSKMTGYSYKYCAVFAKDNYLYALLVGGNGTTRPAKLIKYTSNGGVLTEVSTVTFPTGLGSSVAYQQNGNYAAYTFIDDDYSYVIGDFDTASIPKLYKINTLTGGIVSSVTIANDSWGNLFSSINSDYLLYATKGNFQPHTIFTKSKSTLLDVASNSFKAEIATNSSIGEPIMLYSCDDGRVYAGTGIGITGILIG